MAVNYADAKKKALARDPKTAVCLDYGDAWFFARSEEHTSEPSH